LLKAFVNVDTGLDTLAAQNAPTSWTAIDKAIAWKVGIHILLVVSGVLFALMDKIAESTPKHGSKH
jgi:uncharacterized membrane protein YqhA